MSDRSPLFDAQHELRYQRQTIITNYEGKYECRFIVLIDAIFPFGVTLFEELLFDADKNQDLHLMLSSPGGDGETAVRLVRAAQSRCKELTVIVPDQAKAQALFSPLERTRFSWVRPAIWDQWIRNSN